MVKRDGREVGSKDDLKFKLGVQTVVSVRVRFGVRFSVRIIVFVLQGS